MQKPKGVVRYELKINSKHKGYYMSKKELDTDIDDFYLCKPKWYDTEEEYEGALEYRNKAKIEVLTHILKNEGEEK